MSIIPLSMAVVGDSQERSGQELVGRFPFERCTSRASRLSEDEEVVEGVEGGSFMYLYNASDVIAVAMRMMGWVTLL